jgi:hypothetical protein
VSPSSEFDRNLTWAVSQKNEDNLVTTEAELERQTRTNAELAHKVRLHAHIVHPSLTIL